MTCREIYEAALAMLAESMASGDNDDYKERAPYLLAAFCTDIKETDAMWREACVEDAQGEWNAVYLPLEDDFPLSDRLAPAAAYYLASMLVLDSNESLSDRLYDECSDILSRVKEGIPSTAAPIINRYAYE